MKGNVEEEKRLVWRVVVVVIMIYGVYISQIFVYIFLSPTIFFYFINKQQTKT